MSEERKAVGEDTPPPRPRRWRRTLRVLHRDIGFLCVGLTVVYAVSGVAVNHSRDWDYNSSLERRSVVVGTPALLLGGEVPGGAQLGGGGDPGELARSREAEVSARVASALGRRPSQLIKSFWRGPNRLSLFFSPGGEDLIDYDPTTGVAVQERQRDRPLLRALNALHLNESGGAWTGIADAFALLLLFLALSGAVMVKGRRGVWGRGGALVVLGFVVPVVFVLLLS